MKKLLIISLTLAVMMLGAGAALAGSHGNHGEHSGHGTHMDSGHGKHMDSGHGTHMDHGANHGAMSHHDGMMGMEKSLDMMGGQMQKMEADFANRNAYMKDFNTHMMEMHHSMEAVRSKAKAENDGTTLAIMVDMDNGMKKTMKGMGQMKANSEEGFLEMKRGVQDMYMALDMMKKAGK
ncbi:hypothetical protein [Desulfobaculum bizertense]|uniref:Heavy-metal resistance n=1 Tax=Desulfobaculum bizertense DSM 18034 TaxID=1121442 RepID=A0A1T4VQY0_9BACT|nr:hypothetical protein [Desulfobaculum bizertense]UIJ38311.1 hypothetical protein LWC08_01740 [Desulfobaculum bizertense]SKA67360.1 hypothetical protein SAMN02745702_00809 [Desulfobaculum bizertense DSM 18034]